MTHKGLTYIKSIRFEDAEADIWEYDGQILIEFDGEHSRSHTLYYDDLIKLLKEFD